MDTRLDLFSLHCQDVLATCTVCGIDGMQKFWKAVTDYHVDHVIRSENAYVSFLKLLTNKVYIVQYIVT